VVLVSLVRGQAVGTIRLLEIAAVRKDGAARVLASWCLLLSLAASLIIIGVADEIPAEFRRHLACCGSAASTALSAASEVAAIVAVVVAVVGTVVAACVPVPAVGAATRYLLVPDRNFCYVSDSNLNLIVRTGYRSGLTAD